MIFLFNILPLSIHIKISMQLNIKMISKRLHSRELFLFCHSIKILFSMHSFSIIFLRGLLKKVLAVYFKMDYFNLAATDSLDYLTLLTKWLLFLLAPEELM